MTNKRKWKENKESQIKKQTETMKNERGRAAKSKHMKKKNKRKKRDESNKY